MITDPDAERNGEARPSLITRLRVELRPADGGAEVLAHLAAFAQHTTLDPFVAWLVQRRRTGDLVLVDEATGAVVTHRTVGPAFPTHRRRVASRPHRRRWREQGTTVAAWRHAAEEDAGSDALPRLD